MSKVLIIEDEQDIADLEKDYLEMSDYEVDVCNTGLAGLEAARNNSYDLVVLDLMLPEMDGFEVCKEIRKTINISNYESEKTQLIFMQSASQNLLTNSNNAFRIKCV